ncbi:hypothetical protein CERZMDRAFT_105937 [Cercospora zeae-maydis SCOH1-5]|uniref:Uncharacterized protein n=1 Tax=Cercospora zeae-maydis SCOH1-5 TaxID=717836 RepID=A0A6A6FIR7_9PEZI|nr:hypothetical protein CERZMDRAFT_105937 [Cercospora zeae-maydis SCOH1-5]
MGLFVHEDGHVRGWLAALLCCWAAFGDDETYGEKNTKANISRPQVCNDQPTPLQPMSVNPAQSLSKQKNGSFTDHDLLRPISERPPSLKPLDFGEMSLMGRMALHGRRKSSTNLLWSPKRISIGPPKDFRKLDVTEKQRRSLKPLQLEPVVLKGHEDGVASDGVVLPSDDADAANRFSYREARDTPWQRCQQMSATAHRDPSPPRAREHITPSRDTTKKPNTPRPPLSTQSSSSSIKSLRRQAIETSASGNPSSISRPSVERLRLHRKRSNQSNRMSSADSRDLDQEILELNTIVEERRAESSTGPSHEDLHVPAVAPTMGLRARSETLSDIGSAFSRPLRLETNYQAIPEAVSPFKSPVKSRLSRPFTNMPDPNVTVQEVGVVRRPSSRVTGWLSSILSSSNTASADTTTPQPFYSVRRRTVSQSSMCSTVTELESPYLSATSSPVSKGHSRERSLVSPPSTACTSEFDVKSTRRKSPAQWVHVQSPSQVGLAL